MTIRDTQYWLSEMYKLDCGGTDYWAEWHKLRSAMNASVSEEQAPATHAGLLDNARESVDRDLERAGWRGVMAYVGTALRRLEDDTPLRIMAQDAHGELQSVYICPFGSCPIDLVDTPCTLCPHAKWPDFPATGKTDPEPHNPAPETQEAEDWRAKPFEIREQLEQAYGAAAYWKRRTQEEEARADKVSARRDKARARAEKAEYQLRATEHHCDKQNGYLNTLLDDNLYLRERITLVSARRDKWRERCETLEKLVRDMHAQILLLNACHSGDNIPDATKKVHSCEWSYDELEGKWDTGCGNAFWFAEPIETPSSSGFTHCAYCGGVITKEAE